MIINSLKYPNFTSNFINRTQIIKTGNGIPIDASFIEIDSSNYNDVKAMEAVDKLWGGNTFATNIYQAARAKRNKSVYYAQSHIYALTLQDKDFDKIEPGQILGVAHINKKANNAGYLENIQSKPDCVYSINPEYKYIGSGILNSLKKLYNEISLTSSNRKFYVKNGFKEITKNHYVWKNNN